MNIPTIETDRLILRGFEESDLEAYALMCADPEVMKYLSTGKTLSMEESWRSLAFILGHWQLRKFGLWAVEEKESGIFVGRVGLFNPNGWPGIEVGWTLAKSSWGKGYATEAAKSSITWGFNNINVNELISLILPENTASASVSKRIGQRYTKQVIVQGKAADLYSISR